MWFSLYSSWGSLSSFHLCFSPNLGNGQPLSFQILSHHILLSSEVTITYVLFDIIPTADIRIISVRRAAPRHFSIFLESFLFVQDRMTKLEESWLKLSYFQASLVAQMVKNEPAMQETWVPSLCWEDPLEKGMATDSSILAWRILWTEEPGRLQSMGSRRVGHNCAHTHNWLTILW